MDLLEKMVRAKLKSRGFEFSLLSTNAQQEHIEEARVQLKVVVDYIRNRASGGDYEEMMELADELLIRRELDHD